MSTVIEKKVEDENLKKKDKKTESFPSNIRNKERISSLTIFTQHSTRNLSQSK